MERLAYILDTNVVADYINQFEPTTTAFKKALRDQHLIYLCQPVYYEVLRGLARTNAVRKLQVFEEQFAPQLVVLPLVDEDWRLAAQFWADAVNKGKQLSDVDLLIAALAHRLDAWVVSADDDFDALPIRRLNWRKS